MVARVPRDRVLLSCRLVSQALLAAGVFDQDPSHGLGGSGEEVAATVQLRLSHSTRRR